MCIDLSSQLALWSLTMNPGGKAGRGSSLLQPGYNMKVGQLYKQVA